MSERLSGEGRDMVRVLHLGPDPSRPGGMAAVVRDLLASPLRESYRLEMLPTYRTRRAVPRLFVFARALGTLALWCRGPGARIVHVHSAVRGSLYRKSLCVMVARLFRCPVIVHIHAGAGDAADFVESIGPVRLRLFKLALDSADRVLSVSAEGAHAVQRLFGLDQVAVVPNAAPQPQARAGDDRDARNRNRIEILYLGGFADPAKGGKTLVEALPRLRASCPDALITFAGPGEQPAELRRARQHGGVDWVGWLEDEAKEQRLASCDLFTLPSISEGLPVALLEAMAHGCAIVASRVGGVPDVLTDGHDAVLVPPGDASVLASRLAELAQDVERRLRLGRAAQERAIRLNQVEVSGRIDTIYRGLVA